MHHHAQINIGIHLVQSVDCALWTMINLPQNWYFMSVLSALAVAPYRPTDRPTDDDWTGMALDLLKL